MKSVNNKIIVSVDPDQKNSLSIGGNVFSTALSFDNNYREKSPTICRVVDGNEYVKEGDVLLCHHNLFYLPSPYHLYDDLFSIPYSKVLFAKVDAEGNLHPLCGNLLCDRVDIESKFYLIEKEKYIDRVVVADGSGTKYKKGELLFTRPFSFYEIIWNWNGEERRVHKCDSDMVVGRLSG